MWDDVVKEAWRVESTERLLDVNAHAMTETQRTRLPVNLPKGFGHEGLGEAVLADLLAHVGHSHGVLESRKTQDLQMWAMGIEWMGTEGA